MKVGPDHRAVQGRRHLRRAGRGRPPCRAQGRRPRHPRPGQRRARVITASSSDAGDDSPRSPSRTDLTVTGKVAQFGRGVMADVSGQAHDQFADNLAADRARRRAPPPRREAAARRAPPVTAEAVIAEALARTRGSSRRRRTRSRPRRASPNPRRPRPPATRKIDSPEAEPDRPARHRRRRRSPSGSCRPSASLADPRHPVRLLRKRRDRVSVAEPTPTIRRRRVRRGLPRPSTPRAAARSRPATPTGGPTVIRNAPFLDDGTPMPTRYWLVDPDLLRRIGTLESDGGVRQAEAEVDPADARRRPRPLRRRARRRHRPPITPGPRPSGGVGGTASGVKCLHTHYAWFLAGGDDPVGRWVDEQLAARADRRLGGRRRDDPRTPPSTAAPTRPACSSATATTRPIERLMRITRLGAGVDADRPARPRRHRAHARRAARVPRR